MILTTPLKTHRTWAIALAFLLGSALALPSEVHAQPIGPNQNASPGQRKIPANAVLGQAQVQQQNALSIDGLIWMVSPGATLRDERNMLTNVNVLHRPRAVRFTTNAQGMVDKLWILNDEEASDEALEKAGVEPANWMRDVLRGALNTLL